MVLRRAGALQWALMDATIIAAVLITAMFVLYGITTGVESSTGLFKLFPGLLAKGHNLPKAFSPLWKISHLFLGAGLVGSLFFFSNGVAAIGDLLLPVFLAMFALLVIRSSLYVYLFRRSRAVSHAILWAFLVTSLGIPVLLSVALAALMTGEVALNSLSLALAGIAITMTLFLGSTFLLHDRAEHTHLPLTRMANILFMILAVLCGIILPRVMLDEAPHVYTSPWFSAIFAILIIIGVTWFMMNRTKKFYQAFGLASLLLTGLFFALLAAQWPFLVFPWISFEMAYGGSAVGAHPLAGFALIFLALCIGFYLLYSLSNKSVKNTTKQKLVPAAKKSYSKK